jgi:diketogulonate reductase-like aldo/keto reductase
MAATLEALIELREGGLARAIGVCNFNLSMIRRAVEEIGAPIAAHQVEYHAFLSQAPMLDYLRSKANEAESSLRCRGLDFETILPGGILVELPRD